MSAFSLRLSYCFLLLTCWMRCSVSWTTVLTSNTVDRLSLNGRVRATSLPVSNRMRSKPGRSRFVTTSIRKKPMSLHNIPPPDEEDTIEFMKYASQQSPPESFFTLQLDCTRSVRLARAAGYKLVEVEFPPLPANVMEMDDVSAYDVARASLSLAIKFASALITATKQAEKNDDTASKGKPIRRVSILFPDEDEARIAYEKFLGGVSDPAPGVTVQALRRSDENDDRLLKPEQLLLGLFGGNSGGAVKPVPGTDVYICLTFSAQELPDIEELHLLDPDSTIIFYNLKLDTLRGDLGAPAFPSKEFQDRFLSKVKPVYYLRTRQYSRTTSKPPFVVNFQGCLFRAFPGEFQTLLDTGNGSYRRVASVGVRPALGEFKQQLVDELANVGVLDQEEKGGFLSFLRTGYKVTTWWEDERSEASIDWKT